MKRLLKKSIEQYKKAHDSIHENQKIMHDIRAKSKNAIALLRRENYTESREVILEAEELFKEINRRVGRNETPLRYGAYTEAVEEYIEALTFHNYLTGRKSGLPKFVEAGPEEVIAGISDFTGELVRKAVTSASVENLHMIVSYKKEIEYVAEELTKIGFRGKLRQKYDEVERNLNKMENIVYDLKLKKRD